MSFYDDASLVFLPSGGAGKDGKAYSIKPVPEYGTELITNGGFNTDSDWIKGAGWTISGGKAVRSGASGNSTIYQNVPVVNGKKYIFSYTRIYVSGNGETNLYVRLDGVNYSTIGKYISTTNEEYKVVGEFTAEFTGNLLWQIYGISDFTGSIDNVSVKEVIVGDGDFTFSRGSNLTATRVDSNGLIEKGRENLLLQSNQFDTTWTTDGASVTSGQSGYDGSSDAWKLSGTGGSFPRVQQNKSISGVSTFSVYAKAGNVNVLRLLTISGSNTDVKFQLTGSGSVLTQTGSERIESKITRLGSTDWYRCSITFNGSPTNFRIYPMSDSSTFAVNGEFVYIQDAQVEIGLVATEYIESGATTGKAGILEDSPRFDYSGGASCPSLLLEPSRTNLIEQSEYFDSWSSVDTTISLSAITSPEGLQNAYLMPITGSSSRVQILPSFGSGTYSLSVYAKSDSNATIRLLVIADGSVQQQYFTTTSDWDRYVFTFTASTSLTQIQIRSGQTDADNVYIYGAQLEEGSYPTSYIPNHSGGSVTRNGENKYLQNSSILSSGDGTIFWELDEFDTNTSADGFNQIIYVSKNSDSSLNDTIYLDEYIGNFRIYIRKNNILILSSETGYADLRGSKIAISWNSSGAKIFIDGVENASYVGDASNTFEFFGHDRPYNDAIKSSLKLKQEMYFPTALSDVELEILTGTSYESFAEMATALNYTIYE